jgi:hypothetical protein
MAFSTATNNSRAGTSKDSSAYSTNPASDYKTYCSTAPSTMDLFNTPSIHPSQPLLQDIHTKTGLLAFQLHSEQQKSALLQQIIKMQDEKIKVLQSKTSFVCSPEPEAQQPEDYQTIKYELEAARAKAIYLEDKCSLQERIINLQKGWIEDLQWNGSDEVEMEMGESSSEIM